MPLGSRRAYLFTHPEHVAQILQDPQHVYEKGLAAGRATLLFGESLTAVDGDRWHHQRRAMRPAFQPRLLGALGPVIAETTTATLNRWEELAERGQQIDLMGEMVALTRAIILRAIFGPLPSSEVEAVGRALEVVSANVSRRLWRLFDWAGRLPTPDARRCGRALLTLDAFVRDRLARTRPGGAAEAGLASALLDAQGGAPAGAALHTLHMELRALLFAGHTTTSSALVWSWYLLAQHPEADRRLDEELSAALGDRLPTADDVATLPFLRMLVDEVLRLYPPTWLTGRVPAADDEVGGYPVPAKTLVLLSPFVTHRHPAFWQEPSRFDPERFTPERAAGRPRFAYFPFGGGPRACIGSGLALMELRMIVALVAQRYRLGLVPGREIEIDAGVTLRPRDGMPMVLHRRGPSSARAGSPRPR